MKDAIPDCLAKTPVGGQASGKTQGLRPQNRSPCVSMVAGARNHLPANRALAFRFEVTI